MKKIFFPLIFTTLFIIRIVFSFIIWHPDLNNHADWGIRFFEYGTKAFYSPEANVWSFTWPNQPPGTMYMFAGVRKIYEFVFNIFWQINVKVPAFPSIIVSYFETNLYPALLKLPAIMADFGIAYLIYKITKKKWLSVVWLVNPFVWYNSTIWGQYDSVINFFALLSFYLLLNRKITASLLFLVLSFYIKASLLIFAPIWIIVAFKQKYLVRNWAKSIALTFVVFGLLTLPFADKNPFLWIYELYTKKVFTQQLHLITANAFNLWSFLAGIHERPDSLPFLGLTYQIWGYILFGITYISVVLRLFRSRITNQQSLINILIWSLSVVAFASFVLLTNMHERYLYPLFPYLTMLLGLGFVWNWFYWGVSFVGLLNMYNFWFTPRFEPIISFLSFNNRLMPRILGFIMLLLFLSFFKKYNESK